MPMARELNDRWKAWIAGGAICSEMEAAAILILGSIYRVRTGGAMLMSGAPETAPTTIEEVQNFKDIFDTNRVIRVAIEGLKVLIESDRKNQ